MKVIVGKETVSLSDATRIGVGGEAEVHRHRDLALKIYSALAPDAIDAKLAKIAAFPARLPPTVIAPIAPVLSADRRRRPLGFSMALLEGVDDLRRLSVRRHREGLVPNERVMLIFRRLHALLAALHAEGVVVGDLNDSNVVYSHDEPFLIDADSMQVGPHRCLVAHERFLDPRLFGADFAASAVFTPESDWYAFAVMLFQTLLYVHPYGGTHPAHGTLLRRAEARCSVLRPEVVPPKGALSSRILPDELTAYFAHTFDRDGRDTFPYRLLDITWTRCAACGLEHARRACPDCASKGAPVFAPPTVHHGRCRAVPILRTRGRVLTVAMHDRLSWLVDEDGICRRESGERVWTQPLEPGLRFALAGPATYVALGRRVVGLRGERPFAKHDTQPFARAPMFAATPSRCLVIDGDWLVDASAGIRLGSVLGGHTWFRASERMGYGSYRAGRVTAHFVFDPRRPGLTDVALPPIEGRLLDVDVAFDEGLALISTRTEKDGRVHASLRLVDVRGRILGSLEGAPDDSPLLGAVRGKAIASGRALVALEGQGLASVEVLHGALAIGRVYPDTAPFVGAESTILPGPSGSVYVATTKEITQLSLA